uniref:ubiquitinyl hydrolase 1 n=1 Tax=Parastrongyloides trichosuri TaxID=131310 RepID=A0A0N4ZUB1_PARTI
MAKDVKQNNPFAGIPSYFTNDEHMHLYKYFCCICNNVKQLLDIRRFMEICVDALTQNQLSGLFHAFDDDKNGYITFIEYIVGLSLSCRGSSDEKIKFIFKMFKKQEGDTFDKETINCIYNELSISEEGRNLDLSNGALSYMEVFNWAKELQEFDDLLDLIKQNAFISLSLPLTTLKEEVFLLQRYKDTYKRSYNTEIIIVSSKWWNSMIGQLLSNSKDIKPINNDEDILDIKYHSELATAYGMKSTFGGLLKKGLIENVDYVPLDKYMYFCLERKYGSNSAPVIRYINSKGQIDLYPPIIFFYVTSEKGENLLQSVWSFPRTLPLWHLKLFIQRNHSTDRNVEISFYALPQGTLIEDGFKTIEDIFGKQMHIKMLISFEYYKTLGPEDSDDDSDENSDSSINIEDTFSSNDSLQSLEVTQLNLSTIVGLANLGNSCYMNSVLQCLMRTKTVTEYIIERYNDVGEDNTLASAYGKFLRKIFTRPNIIFFPKELKRVISEKCPSFANFYEQDAGEFLSSFLNTISEEIAASNKENGIEPDMTHLTMSPADIEWKKKLKNENSIITQEIFGQLRSSLTCESCSYISDTYEPFTLLQLPIPADDRILITIIFLSLKDVQAIRLCLLVSGKENFSRVQKIMHEKTNVPESNLIYRFVDNNGSFCPDFPTLPNDFENGTVECLAPDGEHNIVAFEVSEIGSKTMIAYGRLRYIHTDNVFKANSSIFFGLPFILHYIPKITRVCEFYDYVYHRVYKNEEKDVANKVDENEEPKYPFVIKMVNISFEECGWCNYPETCHGCSIDECGEFLPVGKYYFAIEWKSETLQNNSSLKENFRIKSNNIKSSEEIEYYTPISLSSCLNAFLKPEILDHELTCSSCLTKVKMKKQFRIERQPNTLIVNLKRFMVYSSNSSKKLSKGVDFPLTDFRIVENGDTYECYAMVNHIGDINNGHYIACAKIDGTWHVFDDINVEEITVDQIDKTNPYILFYRKENI